MPASLIEKMAKLLNESCFAFFESSSIPHHTGDDFMPATDENFGSHKSMIELTCGVRLDMRIGYLSLSRHGVRPQYEG